jgi:excisionase family DNA binding protein
MPSADTNTASYLLSTRELAAFLGVSVPTILNWKRKGIGPPRCLMGDRLVRYRREDVERWLEEQVERTP